MRWYRITLIATGALLLTFGVLRLVTNLAPRNLLALGLWLLLAVALHDVLLAPTTAGVGLLLTHLPTRGRRYVQGALIVAALITVIALPLIDRRGAQPAVKAILLRDYAGNLAILLGLTAALAIILYLARVLRERRAAAASPSGQ